MLLLLAIFLPLIAALSTTQLPTQNSATALFSPSSERLYLFHLGEKQELSYLPILASFTASNLTAATKPLPSPPRPPPPISTKGCGNDAKSVLPEYSQNLFLVPGKDDGDKEDELYVLTSAGSSALTLHKFSLDSAEWQSQPLTPSRAFSGSVPPGRALAGGFLHSAQEKDIDLHRLYLFGGANASASCSSVPGNFSSALTSLDLPIEKGKKPKQRRALEDRTIVVEQDATKGRENEWPIPEAGFSVTYLPELQRAVVIGGATEGAQLGLDQIAVYKTDEQAWEFMSVEKDDRVQSRSGHSAVATSDGRRIVVFGGYTGGREKKAVPELVVLEMDGEKWRWTVPEVRGEGKGLWGHAAGLLGDTMVVTGGFTGRETPNKKAYLFNTATDTWETAYNLGADADDLDSPSEPSPPAQPSTPPPESHPNIAAIATGTILAILLVLLTAGACCLTYHRRHRRRRHPLPTLRLSESDLENSSSSASSKSTSPITPTSTSTYWPPRCSPIPEHAEYRLAPPPQSRQNLSPNELDALYRRSYDLARELTAVEDATEPYGHPSYPTSNILGSAPRHARRTTSILDTTELPPSLRAGSGRQLFPPPVLRVQTAPEPRWTPSPGSSGGSIPTPPVTIERVAKRDSLPGSWTSEEEDALAEAERMEGSVVQVMFSAPKGVLRVINLDENGSVKEEEEVRGRDGGVGTGTGHGGVGGLPEARFLGDLGGYVVDLERARSTTSESTVRGEEEVYETCDESVGGR